MRIQHTLSIFAAVAVVAMACNQRTVDASPVAATGVALPAGAATPAVPAAKPAQRAGKQYTVDVRPVTLTVGKTTTTKLVIKPAKGLHFNKEFPSKFVVTAGKHARSDKPKLTARGGDVKIAGETGVVTVPITAIAAGRGSLTIMGSFSVCSDEQCYVLRGELLGVDVTVK